VIAVHPSTAWSLAIASPLVSILAAAASSPRRGLFFLDHPQVRLRMQDSRFDQEPDERLPAMACPELSEPRELPRYLELHLDGVLVAHHTFGRG
jgi:hypothetical protein